MKNHKLFTEKIQRIKEQKPVVFIAYICLVFAILIFLGDIGKFSYNGFVVLGNVFLFCGMFWMVRFKRKNGLKMVGLVLALYILLFWRKREVLHEQLYAMVFSLVHMKESSNDFTLLFLAFSVFFPVFCLFFVFVLHKGWMFYGFTLSILLLGPMFGYQPSWLVLGFLIIFHIGNSVYHTVYQKWSDETEEKNTRAAVLQKGFALGLFMVLLSFFLAHGIPLENRKSWMKESVQFTQSLTHDFQSRKNQNPTGIGTDSLPEGLSGKISRGNHYSSGVLQLELTLSEMPKERIYLKNFTGGIYEGDTWAEADETDFYTVFHASQGEKASSYLSPAYFERRQFELIRYGKQEAEGREAEGQGASFPAEPESLRMEIHPVNGAQNSFFLPYLSSYISRDYGGIFSFHLFSWKEYYQYQEKIKEKPLDWFDQMEEPYRTYAAQKYLLLPQERLPRLLALCSEHPLNDADEITNWITQTLADSAVYSQTPGFMPYGTDIAEYFLFDRKEGYCQHFATAAVLMYRIYGIPARYVTGYAADPKDFSLESDGQYHARLTDERAHAWAEIYVGGPGWIPVEVTPLAELPGNFERKEEEEEAVPSQEDEIRKHLQEERDKQTEDENGESREESTENPAEEEWNKEERNRTEEAEEFSMDAQRKEDVSDTADDVQKPETGKNRKALFFAGAGILLAVVCSAAAIKLLYMAVSWAGKKQRKKKLQQLGADELYQKMVALLHRCGFVKEWDGTEPAFCQAVFRQLEKENMLGEGGLSQEELEEIKAHAFQTAYGKEVSSDKERKKVQEGYEKLAAKMMDRQHGIKKWQFTLIEAVLVWEKEKQQ